MGDAFITRRGGGGGLSPNNALIHVNAPLGSSISFSKGGVTAKILDPSKGHANVDGKSADYYYSVSTSNFGDWTITATLSDDSTSDTVTVDTVKQYDVELSYFLYLYKYGNERTSVTGGWVAASGPAYSGGASATNTPTLTREEFALYATQPKNSGGSIRPANSFDITPYSTFHGEIRVVSIESTSYMRLTIASQIGQYWDSYRLAYWGPSSTTAEKDYSFNVDVSALSGTVRFFVGMYSPGGTVTAVRIKELYFTK